MGTTSQKLRLLGLKQSNWGNQKRGNQKFIYWMSPLVYCLSKFSFNRCLTASPDRRWYCRKRRATVVTLLSSVMSSTSSPSLKGYIHIKVLFMYFITVKYLFIAKKEVGGTLRSHFHFKFLIFIDRFPILPLFAPIYVSPETGNLA